MFKTIEANWQQIKAQNKGKKLTNTTPRHTRPHHTTLHYSDDEASFVYDYGSASLPSMT